MEWHEEASLISLMSDNTNRPRSIAHYCELTVENYTVLVYFCQSLAANYQYHCMSLTYGGKEIKHH